jgi:3-oxoacyl-[acyl-carrier protein] reductase
MLLAEHGADVAIAARTVADLEATSARVEAATSRRCLVVPTDVKIEESVVNLIETVITVLGRIDILVNNAGGTRMSSLAEIPTRAWDSNFELNVRSAYVATREAGRHMVDQGSGTIVNISSGAGVHGVKGGAHYSSSKAALQMFTRVTAAEWGRYRIRANCIAVGGVASERASAAWEVAGIDPKILSAGSALGRVGEPTEVAQVIHFLACDASSYISGETISVNGGPSLGGISDA